MKKVVVLGGGTGLSSILKGLKNIDQINLAAIVSVSDDGGSTGIIRNEFTIPAVGDLRQVIVSLSEKETLIEKIMSYRFSKDNLDSLKNHSLGNLILTALIDMEKDFYKGIEKITNVLKLKGKVLPVTNYDKIHLRAKYDDGSITIGESNIPNVNKRIISIDYLDEEKIIANPIALKEIEHAHYIILGIGSLYTSLIANLVIPSIKETILRNKKAKLIYIANIMTQPGETHDMTLSEHINEIEKYLEPNAIDIVLVNKEQINCESLNFYKDQNANAVESDFNKIDNKIKIIEADLLDQNNYKLLKHDPNKIKKAFELLFFMNEKEHI